MWSEDEVSGDKRCSCRRKVHVGLGEIYASVWGGGRCFRWFSDTLDNLDVNLEEMSNRGTTEIPAPAMMMR